MKLLAVSIFILIAVGATPAMAGLNSPFINNDNAVLTTKKNPFENTNTLARRVRDSNQGIAKKDVKNFLNGDESVGQTLKKAGKKNSKKERRAQRKKDAKKSNVTVNE